MELRTVFYFLTYECIGLLNLNTCTVRKTLASNPAISFFKNKIKSRNCIGKSDKLLSFCCYFIILFLVKRDIFYLKKKKEKNQSTKEDLSKVQDQKNIYA